MREEAVTMGTKSNTNPFAVAELTLAQEIRSSTEISGIFDGEPVSVFAACEEDLSGKIRRAIARGVGQCVCVRTESAEAAERENGGLRAKVRLVVEVTANGATASQRRKSTSDLAFAIVAALDGALFEPPFTEMPVLWTGSDVYDDGVLYGVALRFEANILLKN